MMTVDDVLRMAKAAGVTVLLDGYDIVLEHDTDPPPNLVTMFRRFKPELVSALRMRQADQRNLITRGSTTTSSPCQQGSAHIAAEERERTTPSSPCSLGPTGARCTAHIIRLGWLSEKPRRAGCCDFNGLPMSGPLVLRRAGHDSARNETSGSIALRRQRHLWRRRRRPRGGNDLCRPPDIVLRPDRLLQAQTPHLAALQMIVGGFRHGVFSHMAEEHLRQHIHWEMLLAGAAIGRPSSLNGGPKIRNSGPAIGKSTRVFG
jgi:hypothetical protein